MDVYGHPSVLWDVDYCPAAGRGSSLGGKPYSCCSSDPLQCICAVQLFVKLSCKSWAAVTQGRGEALLNMLLCETALQCQAGRQQRFFHGDCN